MIYHSAKIKRTIVIHLSMGEDVLESIKAVIAREGIKSGLVLTGYGTLDIARFHYITHTNLPPNDEFKVIRGPLELTGMHGVIADGEPHIHFTFSDMEQAYGGHLEPGCRTLYLCDIVLAELEDVDMSFVVDPVTKLRGLTLTPRIEEPGVKVEVEDARNVRIVKD
ncbi:MAG: DNA-binding protein [Firmicutes bacterium]|nr:DNA-binding protein [Bacillota bacterium]